MGSTSSEAHAQVLEAMSATGIEYAFLHGRELYERGELGSDLDLLVNASPWQIVSKLQARLLDLGLTLILAWESDVGTLNTFWWDGRTETGCQVDLLHDE